MYRYIQQQIMLLYWIFEYDMVTFMWFLLNCNKNVVFKHIIGDFLHMDWQMDGWNRQVDKWIKGPEIPTIQM